MPTRIRTADHDTQDFLQELIRETYLDGQCYKLAIALHRGLGWPLVGLIQADQDVMRHAAVYHPNGALFDARGEVTEEEFMAPFGPGKVVPLATEFHVRHLNRPIPELAIMTAGKLAMSVWPDLPWTEYTYLNSMMAFLAGLEALCREHGFWLRDSAGLGSAPALWPSVAVAEGDESGYKLAATGVGSYVINRVLKGE